MPNFDERDIVDLLAATQANRPSIEYQLEKLTGYDIQVSEAKETVKELYRDDGNEIFDLQGVGSLRGHFLLREGYNSIEAIANSSVSDLEAVRYLGSSSANTIHRSAVEAVQDSGSIEGPTAEKEVRDQCQESQIKEPPISLSESPSVESGVYPVSMIDSDQWVLWKIREGDKIPVAPWHTGTLYGVNGQSKAVWTSFENAVDWRDKMPRNLGLGFVLSEDDPYSFIDYDDVRDESGKLLDRPRRHLERLNSYSAVSTSGTGIHVYTRADLSENVKSVVGKLEPGSIEIYDKNRFIALTGKHLESTPKEATNSQRVVEALEDFFAKSHASSPIDNTYEHSLSVDVSEIEETSEIEVVFEAIRQISPGDIHLSSPKTEDRADGTASYDPVWAESKSGTRLAELEDRWVYRKGMYALDALQVVALEEGIIRSVSEYPSGQDFWDALDALRDRGAYIPTYSPEDS